MMKKIKLTLLKQAIAGNVRMKGKTTAVLIVTKDEKYAVWMKVKASSVSDPNEEKIVQDIVIHEDDIMLSIQHCLTLDDLQRKLMVCWQMFLVS